MDKIYYYEWFGSQTGWEYRLEFTPAGETPIGDSPSYFRLPLGSIESKGRNKNLDKYPFGLAEGCVYDFIVYLSEIPNNAEYKEFFDCIINPIKVVDIPIPFIYSDISKAPNIKNVQLGTIVRLKIRFHGNEDHAPRDWHLAYTHFEGCIRENNNIKLDLVKNVAEMTAVDINKCVLTSFNFSMISDFDQQANVNGYLDKADRNNVYPFVVSCFGNKEGFDETVIASKGEFRLSGYNPPKLEGDLEYHFAKFNIIRDYINYVGQFLYCSLMRTDAQIEICPQLKPGIVYHQLPNSTGEKGHKANISDIYILSYVINKIYSDNSVERIVIGGLFTNSLDIGLNQRYPNSIWDFLKDFTESFLLRYDPTYLTSGEIEFRNVFGEPAETFILKMSDINSIEIEMNKNILKKVTSSLPEKHQGGDFSDTDKYEVTKLGTRNEGEYTLPIVFYTNPLHITYKRDDTFKDVIFHSNPQILHSGLYSIRKATTHTDYDKLNSGKDYPVLMHENMGIWLGYGAYESNTDPIIYPQQATIAKYYREADRMQVGPSELIYTIQNSKDAGGYPRYIADLLMNIYSNDNQHEITIEINYNKYISVLEGGSNSFHWWSLSYAYEIDWTSFGSYWGRQYKYWRPISIELDDDKEIVKLKLYPETIEKVAE